MASFRIDQPSKDIHLVVRLEKVLIGESDAATAIYSKSPVKPKESAKFAALVDASAQRIGGFSQAFGVAIVPLFKEDNSAIYGNVKRAVVLDRIARLDNMSDDAVFRNFKFLLADKVTKLKVYPGTLHFEFQAEKKGELPGKINSALLPLEPRGDQVVREVQQFYTEKNGLVPHSEWTNHLFVYPVSINMSNWSGKGFARNLSLEISIREVDTDPIMAKGLPVRRYLLTDRKSVV